MLKIDRDPADSSSSMGDWWLPLACIETTADTFRLNPQVRSFNDK